MGIDLNGRMVGIAVGLTAANTAYDAIGKSVFSDLKPPAKVVKHDLVDTPPLPPVVFLMF